MIKFSAFIKITLSVLFLFPCGALMSQEISSREALKRALEKARAETETRSQQIKSEEDGVTGDKAIEEEKVIKDENVWGQSYMDAINKRMARKKGTDGVSEKRTLSRTGYYLKMARYYLEKDKFEIARKYAEGARKGDAENEEVKELIKEITRRQYYAEEPYPMNREKILEESSEINKYDVVEASKETRGLVDRIKDLFRESKSYDLAPVDAGRVYSIGECVELALSRSPRIRINEEQVKLAEMKLVEAYRDLFPDIDLKMERSTGQIGADNLPRHYRGEKYKVDLKHTLFDGMGTWFALRQSQINFDVNKQEKIKTRNEIIEAVKTAYYDLDKSVKNLTVHEAYVNEVNSYFSIMEKAYEGNVISRSEYLKVKAQNLQANFQYMSAREDLGLAKMNLVRHLNINPESDIKIKAVESPKKTISIGLENCYSLALANEPDLRVKARTVEFYNYERKMKKAVGWPKIEFDGSFGMAYENFQPLNVAGDYANAVDASGPVRAGRGLESEWIAGIKGSVPLWGNTFEYNYVREKFAPTVSAFRGTDAYTSYFTLSVLDKLSYFSDLQEARAGFYNAEYEYEKAKNDLMLQVKEVYFRYRKALLQMEISKSQLEYQKNYVDILKEQMSLGESEASRVVDELGRLKEDEYAVYQSDADYYSSLASMNRAIGIPDYFKPEYEN